MNPTQAKILGSYLLSSAAYAAKRGFGRVPSRIDTVVVDIDHTLIHELGAYASLEKILGPKRAKEAYERQKGEFKAGKKTLAEVKLWGHNLQREHGWTRGDWAGLAERLGRAWLDPAIVEGLLAARRQRPDLRIILATGSSRVFGDSLARYLRSQYGLRFDGVVGSEQTFDPKGRVFGLVRFVGEPNGKVPSIEKIPAIREQFPDFDPAHTLAISDADADLLRRSGIGLLVPVQKSRDPASWLSQKFRLYDVSSKHAALRRDMVRELVLNPQRSVREYRETVKTPLGKTDALSRRIIKERMERLREGRG